jgi:hypothetical protein
MCFSLWRPRRSGCHHEDVEAFEADKAGWTRLLALSIAQDPTIRVSRSCEMTSTDCDINQGDQGNKCDLGNFTSAENA